MTRYICPINNAKTTKTMRIKSETHLTALDKKAVKFMLEGGHTAASTKMTEYELTARQDGTYLLKKTQNRKVWLNQPCAKQETYDVITIEK